MDRASLDTVSAATLRLRSYRTGERVADLAVHVAGLTLALAGVTALLVVSVGGTAAEIVGLTLYGAGLIAMLSFSASYNWVRHPGAKQVLKRFDRAAIYLMIAGTYSPFALGKIAGASGISLLAVVWCLAIVGVTLALALPRRSDRIALGIYLVMGWSIVFVAQPLVEAVSASVVVLLLIGGLIYTAGVAFHLARRLPYHKVVWHSCVLAAAACHYAAIFRAFAPVAST